MEIVEMLDEREVTCRRDREIVCQMIATPSVAPTHQSNYAFYILPLENDCGRGSFSSNPLLTTSSSITTAEESGICTSIHPSLSATTSSPLVTFCSSTGNPFPS